MKNLFLNMWRDDDGQDMVEYVLILGLISIVAVAALTASGGSIQTVWNSTSSALAGATGGA
jgi:pilus assembly protein Flp/PilA